MKQHAETTADDAASWCQVCGQLDHGSNACQAWFWTPEWQAAEREVDADLAVGRYGTFDTMDEFLASLGA